VLLQVLLAICCITPGEAGEESVLLALQGPEATEAVVLEEQPQQDQTPNPIRVVEAVVQADLLAALAAPASSS
jgi:hypothetical protein